MIKQISCISNREGLGDEKHFNINQVQVKESVMKAWKLKKVKKRNLGGNFRLHEWKIKLISTFRYHVSLLYRDHAEKLQILSGFWLKFSVCEYVLLHALKSVRSFKTLILDVFCNHWVPICSMGHPFQK